MKMIVGVMMMFGVLAGCAVSRTGSEDDNESELTSEVGGGTSCYVDFTCPTDFAFFEGVQHGHPSIGEAARDCRDHCGRPCLSSGLLCGT